MSKSKFLTVFGLALLFVLATSIIPEARNRPRLVDHQDQYSHPWGGDENSGGPADGIVAPVKPEVNNPYRYVDGTKSGLVSGAFQFLWEKLEVFLLSYTISNRYDDQSVGGASDTPSSSTGSNSAFSAGSRGGGGQ